MDKYVNNVGFRKKFMIVVNIISAIILFGSILYHIIMGPGHELSEGEMNALLILMGITAASYGAARALPGSVEYTVPDHRSFDSTVKSSSGDGFPPPPSPPTQT
jgi:hypothetical protein